MGLYPGMTPEEFYDWELEEDDYDDDFDDDWDNDFNELEYEWDGPLEDY